MHFNQKVHAFLFLEHFLKGHCDLAFCSKLDRIGNQIRQHLAKANIVCNHIVRVKILERHGEPDVFRLHSLLEHIAQLVGNTAQIQRLFFQFQLSCLDAGQIQDIVDDRQQILRQVFRLAQIFQRFRILAALFLRQRKHSDDAVHGCPNLVGHPGEKLRLRKALLLDFPHLLFQGKAGVFIGCDLMEQKQVTPGSLVPYHIQTKPAFLPRQLKVIGKCRRAVPLPVLLKQFLVYVQLIQQGNICTQRRIGCAEQRLEIIGRTHRQLVVCPQYQDSLLHIVKRKLRHGEFRFFSLCRIRFFRRKPLQTSTTANRSSASRIRMSQKCSPMVVKISRIIPHPYLHDFPAPVCLFRSRFDKITFFSTFIILFFI